MGLGVGSINSENGGAVIGEEKAGKRALKALLDRRQVVMPDH